MIQIATKTLAAIEEALQKDQGAKFRGLLGELMPSTGDAYSIKEESFRNHLGASLIGRECARELWYSFHWCLDKKFDGRMLRLFNRGHLEEPRMVALLTMIGCQVWQVDSNGKQFRISGHRGHFGGSMDGVVIGIPDLPQGMPAISEFKTHGEKSFLKLKADGVLVAKFEHYVQMQIYMGKNNLQWALYVAVNKNTDELYAEIIQFNPDVYQRYLNRSADIIDAVSPPPRIATTPGYFKCKFCDFQQLCHLNEQPAVNCRTCKYSMVRDDGDWVCTVLQWCGICGNIQIDTPSGAVCSNGHEGAGSNYAAISPERQRQACPRWEMNPTIKGR